PSKGVRPFHYTTSASLPMRAPPRGQQLSPQQTTTNGIGTRSAESSTENPTGEFCGKARSSWGSMHHRRDTPHTQMARLADAGLEEGKSTAMVNNRRTQAVPVLRSSAAMQPPCGSVRPCAPYRGELARHRLITADGHDYV